MNYETALLKIESLLKFGSKPGLERIEKLLRMIGDPQDDLKCVHIAGTNGKGSVSFITASVLKESGLKTGLYTSPSIMDFRERIQINGKIIPKKKIRELTEFFEPFLNSREFINDPVTEFELTTAMAFKYFNDEKCDMAVIETGMGGRFDATNIIKNPVCCAVTSVSLDHTEILGNTIEKIAKEKFGIIKSKCPVVLGPCMVDSVYKIADSMALRLKSPVFKAKPQEIQNIKYSLTDGTSFMYKNLSLNTPLLGKHQVTNIATAFKIIDVVGQKFSIPEKAVKIGIKKAHVPCRFEVINRSPLIILDGAHNPAGAEILASAVKTYLKEKKIIGIIGMFKDKDVNGVISKSAQLFSKIITVEPPSNRAFSLAELTNAVKAFDPNVLPCQSVSSAMELAVSLSDARSAIIVFGSFSIMKEARNFIKNGITG